MNRTEPTQAVARAAVAIKLPDFAGSQASRKQLQRYNLIPHDAHLIGPTGRTPLGTIYDSSPRGGDPFHFYLETCFPSFSVQMQRETKEKRKYENCLACPILQIDARGTRGTRYPSLLVIHHGWMNVKYYPHRASLIVYKNKTWDCTVGSQESCQARSKQVTPLMQNTLNQKFATRERDRNKRKKKWGRTTLVTHGDFSSWCRK